MHLPTDISPKAVIKALYNLHLTEILLTRDKRQQVLFAQEGSSCAVPGACQVQEPQKRFPSEAPPSGLALVTRAEG